MKGLRNSIKMKRKRDPDSQMPTSSQRVPKLLDIVHALMERRPDLQFILCGSSARKIRHGAANLLGGRALYRTMHPLTLDELAGDFNLQWILSYGSLPKIYTALKEKKTREAQDLLRAYAITYLREEVKAEALVRNLQGFQNFLDIAVAQYSTDAFDCCQGHR